MKGKALIALLLMVSLIGMLPGLASAGDRDSWRDDRDHRREWRDHHDRRGDWRDRHDRRGDRRDWRGDRNDHNRHGHYRDHDRIRVGNHEYYHRGGRFFRPEPFGLVAIQAPIGAIVATLPIGFSVMVSGGHSYFQAGGAFYSRVPAGYMVVDAPVPQWPTW